MCGIAGMACIGTRDVERMLEYISHRGPDYSGSLCDYEVTFGHNRLAIVDLDSRSNQPFRYLDILLVYNGELWNYKELREELKGLGYEFTTESDTEVVACALQVWGKNALNRFNGMFALAWTNSESRVYLARDRYGEIPLYYYTKYPYYFCSELKGFEPLGIDYKYVKAVSSGSVVDISSLVGTFESRYFNHEDFSDIQCSSDTKDVAKSKVYKFLERGVEERLMSDVPVCTLLSGGIDSSIIAYFLSKKVPNLVAYTAYYNKNSQDYKNSVLLAKQLGIELREVEITKPTKEDLESLIYDIEMPHKAQIEIAWACKQLAKQVSKDGFKVVYSGEGSDELWASYGMSYHGILKDGWYGYRRKLVEGQAHKNFARCNKVFMMYGVECRLPFLNNDLVEYCLSLPQDVVWNGKSKPKDLLQQAFKGILPESICDRSKLAFQDGLKIKDDILSVIGDKSFYKDVYSSKYGKVIR